MNMQHSLIRELVLYEFEMGHNAAETSKNICGMKGEGVADPCNKMVRVASTSNIR